MIESWIINQLFQDLTDPLLITALVLIAIHFGTPLAYYWHAKTRWLPKPWNIRVDENYRPKLTVIVPTYNEAGFIEKKLNNIYEQEYPKDKLEVIIVDSASDDGTPELVREWASGHPNMNLKLIEEGERRGKALALNLALEQAHGDIIIIADADAWWPSRNTLKEVVKWFADPVVGGVSCMKRPANAGVVRVEEAYRRYYNMLRLAESKAWSTPIFHGELAAFRKDLLEEIGGFPTDIGADDSHTATLVALRGHRSIIPEGIWVTEEVPRDLSYHLWRMRRAQHLIQHFLKTVKHQGTMTPRSLAPIITIEAFLHLANPGILIVGVIILIVSLAEGSVLAAILLISGLVFLFLKEYRTWITQQLYLTAAQVRNLSNKELVWEKYSK